MLSFHDEELKEKLIISFIIKCSIILDKYYKCGKFNEAASLFTDSSSRDFHKPTKEIFNFFYEIARKRIPKITHIQNFLI